jgi:hypothetical protein
MQHRDRPEPELGRLDDIDTSEHRHVSPRRTTAPASLQSPRTGHGGMWLGLAALLVVLAGAYFFRDDIRAHFPGSETRALLNSAARAESEARWHGAANGDDALSLYRRLLETDPDNDAARLGLRRVGAQLSADVATAIAAGEFDRASSLIDTMAAIGEPGESVAALRQQLETARVSGSEMTGLLEQARSALARRRIRGENGALTAFKRMLAIDPANAVARRGVDDALQVLAEEAGKEIATGNLAVAKGMIEALAAESPQHAGLPALSRSLAEAETEARTVAAEAETIAARTASAEQARVERERLRMLTRGDEALREGRLSDAIGAYRRVLAGDPAHAEALDGLDLAGRAALDQARSAVANSDPTRAAELLALARRAEADADEIARLDSGLADLNERLAAVLARSELDADQLVRRDELLGRARAAEARGDLVEPAGDSAYDLYRQVLTIDPMDDAARAAVAALPRRAQTLIVHHAELGQLDQATSALQALQAMAPLDPALPELKRQIASAWLERGVAAARSGAIGDARHALDRARELAPAHPGVAALSRELSGG